MASRPEPSVRDAKTRILDAAANVLARRGYHDTNVEEIVSRSGTSKGGFYFHFPSKERMVVGLVEQLSVKLVGKVERAMGHEARPAHRLAIAVDTLLRTFAKQRKLAQLLLVNVVGHGRSLDKKFLPLRDRFAELIQRELDGAVAEGLIEPMDTRLASRVWLGALNEVILQWLMADSPPPLASEAPSLRALLFRSVGISLEMPLEMPKEEPQAS